MDNPKQITLALALLGYAHALSESAAELVDILSVPTTNSSEILFELSCTTTKCNRLIETIKHPSVIDDIVDWASIIAHADIGVQILREGNDLYLSDLESCVESEKKRNLGGTNG